MPPQKTDCLIVRQKMEEYLLWLLPKIDGFPVKQKFILGTKIGQTALELMEKLILIQYSNYEEKAKILKRFNLSLEIFRQLMRLAWKLKFLSHKSFLWQESKLNEIGQMTWRLVHPGGGEM